MNTRTALAATGLLLAATLTACGGGSSGGDSGSKPGGGSKPVDAATAWAAIHKAVPTSRFSLTVTQANDGNHLLGRPHEYTSAVKFADARIKPGDVEGLDKGDVGYGGGIEVFGNHADAQARADYIQTVTKGMPALEEYDYVTGSTVVRVSHYLTPDQAGQYQTAAAKLG